MTPIATNPDGDDHSMTEMPSKPIVSNSSIKSIPHLTIEKLSSKEEKTTSVKCVNVESNVNITKETDSESIQHTVNEKMSPKNKNCKYGYSFLFS